MAKSSTTLSMLKINGKGFCKVPDIDVLDKTTEEQLKLIDMTSFKTIQTQVIDKESKLKAEYAKLKLLLLRESNGFDVSRQLSEIDALNVVISKLVKQESTGFFDMSDARKALESEKKSIEASQKAIIALAECIEQLQVPRRRHRLDEARSRGAWEPGRPLCVCVGGARQEDVMSCTNAGVCTAARATCVPLLVGMGPGHTNADRSGW